MAEGRQIFLYIYYRVFRSGLAKYSTTIEPGYQAENATLPSLAPYGWW